VQSVAAASIGRPWGTRSRSSGLARTYSANAPLARSAGFEPWTIPQTRSPMRKFVLVSL